MRPDTASPFLSMAETCRRLRYSRWTVRKLIRNGEIQAVKGPARNSPLRIPEESVTAYITRYTVCSTTERTKGAA